MQSIEIRQNRDAPTLRDYSTDSFCSAKTVRRGRQREPGERQPRRGLLDHVERRPGRGHAPGAVRARPRGSEGGHRRDRGRRVAGRASRRPRRRRPGRSLLTSESHRGYQSAPQLSADEGSAALSARDAQLLRQPPLSQAHHHRQFYTVQTA